MKKIKFTKHAIKRALERKLLGYLIKDKFYYDATYVSSNMAKVDDVVYVFVETEKQIRIKTLYKDLPATNSVL